MNRLTKRDEKGCAYFDDDGALIRGANGTFHQKKDMTGQFIHQRFVALDKAIDRLAAYEDIGLEPEEVMGLCSMHERAKMAELLRNEENKPLTLEDLKEMDGEPVWREKPGHDGRWVLVDCFWKGKGVIYLHNIHGSSELVEIAFNEGVKVYRRKPEATS